jgi:hypothetical protein
MKKELMSQGAPDAMGVFSRALSMIPEFRGNCHHLAHRIGDTAYYSYGGSLNALTTDHTYDMTLCNFGFFHGYYEHLFQDRPTPEAIAKECSSLPKDTTFYKKMIRQVCVHGGGHGLILAAMDRGDTGDGSVYTAAKEPLAACARLEELGVLSDSELYRCPAGIFTELAQFQYLEEYGFSFSSSSKDWFTDCSRFAFAQAEICVKATAQLLFDKFGPERTFGGCPTLRAELSPACTWGVVWGFFSQKTTEKEFAKALTFCESPAVESFAARSDCYDAVSGEVYSYFPLGEKKALCKRFPIEFQSNCLRRMDL